MNQPHEHTYSHTHPYDDSDHDHKAMHEDIDAARRYVGRRESEHLAAIERLVTRLRIEGKDDVERLEAEARREQA